jgi:hypothetical protein
MAMQWHAFGSRLSPSSASSFGLRGNSTSGSWRGSIATLVTGVLLTWLGHWPLLNAGIPTWTLVGAALFLATIPLVIWVYVPRGKVFGKVFQEALAQNAVTVALRAALSDPVISACYLYEYIMFPVVVALMVIKPF